MVSEDLLPILLSTAVILSMLYVMIDQIISFIRQILEDYDKNKVE